jgi:hypothetical protein
MTATEEQNAYYTEQCITTAEVKSLITSGYLGHYQKITAAHKVEDKERKTRLRLTITNKEETLDQIQISLKCHIYNGCIVVNKKSLEFFHDKYKPVDLTDLLN